MKPNNLACALAIFLALQCAQLLAGDHSEGAANSLSRPIVSHAEPQAPRCARPRASLEKARNLRCLVRYHGFRDSKDFDSTKPDGGSKFQQYVETGKLGEHGVSKKLSLVEEPGLVGFLPWEFSEPDFNLKFSVDSPGNHGISGDGCQVFGYLSLKITDSKGNLIATTDMQLESVVGLDNGAFVSQVTVPLPAAVVQKQLLEGPGHHLLTVVKFQCN